MDIWRSNEEFHACKCPLCNYKSHVYGKLDSTVILLSGLLLLDLLLICCSSPYREIYWICSMSLRLPQGPAMCSADNRSASSLLPVKTASCAPLHLLIPIRTYLSHPFDVATWAQQVLSDGPMTGGPSHPAKSNPGLSSISLFCGCLLHCPRDTDEISMAQKLYSLSTICSSSWVFHPFYAWTAIPKMRIQEVNGNILPVHSSSTKMVLTILIILGIFREILYGLTAAPLIMWYSLW